MTFLSQNTRFSRHFWACYQALITFNDVWSFVRVFILNRTPAPADNSMQNWPNVFKSWSQVAEEEEPRSLSPLNKRQDHQAVEGLLLN